mmetsp:Transcript_34301/g.98789  ORF Transcript_34301/g.98789 Transcript_34301/m.98789 type:complete len:251 (+) Transcript_34301:923-1675(+)
MASCSSSDVHCGRATASKSALARIDSTVLPDVLSIARASIEYTRRPHLVRKPHLLPFLRSPATARGLAPCCRIRAVNWCGPVRVRPTMPAAIRLVASLVPRGRSISVLVAVNQLMGKSVGAAAPSKVKTLFSSKLYPLCWSLSSKPPSSAAVAPSRCCSSSWLVSWCGCPLPPCSRTSTPPASPCTGWAAEGTSVSGRSDITNTHRHLNGTQTVTVVFPRLTVADAHCVVLSALPHRHSMNEWMNQSINE